MSTPKSKDGRPGGGTRRGSPDAVSKRRAARHFNDLLGGGVERAGQLDGRTEKKRQRMLEELREGKVRATGRNLKPIDVLLRVDALLALGEPLTTLKKATRPPRTVPVTDEVVIGVRRLHDAYGFRVDVYQFVGIDEAALAKAGVAPPPRRPSSLELLSESPGKPGELLSESPGKSGELLSDSPGKPGEKPGVARRAPRGATRTKAA